MTNAGRSHDAQPFTYTPDAGTATSSSAEANLVLIFSPGGDIIFGIRGFLDTMLEEVL